MNFISKVVDCVSGLSVRRKMDFVLFPGLIAFPLFLLIVSRALDSETVFNIIVVFLALSVVLFAPISKGLSYLVANRNIRDLNDQCYRLRKGDYSLAYIPPEQGEEHDFMRLKRNLHWMGYAIASREKRLSDTMERLSEVQQQIESSIDYASLIQTSFLPDRTQFDLLFRDHFLLWNQRGKVGGDSYFIKRCGSGFLVAVIDCTGHGVPGAFMTLIVQSLFDKAAASDCAGNPGAVLGRLNRLIKDSLGQNAKGSASDDGLDCTLCHVEPETNRMVFSGAGNPLYIHENSKIRMVPGDRCGIGYVRTRRDYKFTNHEIRIDPGMRFYMATDGVIDQIGGPRRFPFGKSRFCEFIDKNAERQFVEQKQILEQYLDSYRGREPRRDDITVLGFMI